MAGPNTLTFTEDNFESEVLNSDVPVLVDFWATWCGPCRMMAPVIDSVADKYAGKAKIGKLDVDNNHSTAARFQVRGIPMLLVFKGGEVVDSQVGAVAEDKVSEMLDKQIAAAA